MPIPTPEVRQRRLAAIRQAIELGHVGGNEDTEWLLEDVERLEQEIARLKHARVTKRERREWEGIEGDATVLRGYIREFGETPAMTASNRDHWKNRAEVAEAQLATRVAAKLANDSCEGCAGSLAHGRYITLDDVHLCRTCYYAVPKGSAS